MINITVENEFNYNRLMRNVCLVLLVLCCLQTKAQKKDAKLERKISAAIQNFKGDIGIYVHDLHKNKTVAIHADSIFPTASMIKIPILVGIMDKLNKNELAYHQVLTYRDSLLYKGIDILGSFKDSEQIELSKVIMLMLTMSDNTASLWLQSYAGGGARINTLLGDSLGLQTTRVNSRTPGREEAQQRFGWGQTTPREMAALLELIVKRKVVSDSISGRMLRLLGKNYWDEEGMASIPPDVFVADKHGSVDDSRSEVMYVNGDGRSYIVCICTKNIIDQSWQPQNEAWTLTRNISKLLWDYYR